MHDLEPSSPLSHMPHAGATAQFAGEGVLLREEPGMRVVLLFDKPEDAEFRTRITRACGVEPPATPNTTAVGAHSIAWIAPGQWLVIGANLDAGEGTDVSDAYCAMSLSGARAAALLSKSVPAALDAESFAPGRCVRTLMGSMPIFLMARETGDFLVLVERGLARAAWTWLVDGASSFSR